MDSNAVVSDCAALLISDIADSCTVYPGKYGIPAIVMPVPGNPMPRTRGQVAESVVEELRKLSLIAQDCSLTDEGREYYRQHLQNRN